MARPGKAIDAAMLATAIGVHAAVKRQIWGSVVADRRARPLQPDFRAQQLRVAADQHRAADEVEALPENATVVQMLIDYAVLRGQVQVCS